MHIAIRRAAAAYRAREQEEEVKHENAGEACLGIAGHGNGNGIGGRGIGRERGGGRSDDGGKEGRVKVAVQAAVFAASSAAFLYTRGQMCDEESLLRDSLSAFKADSVEKSLRWGRGACFPLIMSLIWLDGWVLAEHRHLAVMTCVWEIRSTALLACFRTLLRISSGSVAFKTLACVEKVFPGSGRKFELP